jgi:acyl-CoA-dependent ceramide synthase
MGGFWSNSIADMYINYPMVERIYGLPTFYLACSGYHIWGSYKHLTSPHKRNDYLEMCVHHLITISLYAGGHIMGDIYSGLLIVYIMDFSDIWVHFAKASCDTHWKKMCDFFGVQMWFWWAYTRLFCLPYCIYWMLFIYPYDLPNMSGSYEGNLYFFKGSLLSMLCIMSLWWFYLISHMLFKAIFSGVQEDV